MRLQLAPETHLGVTMQGNHEAVLQEPAEMLLSRFPSWRLCQILPPRSSSTGPLAASVGISHSSSSCTCRWWQMQASLQAWLAIKVLENRQTHSNPTVFPSHLEEHSFTGVLHHTAAVKCSRHENCSCLFFITNTQEILVFVIKMQNRHWLPHYWCFWRSVLVP